MTDLAAHHLTRRGLHIYHVQHPTPKHVENSDRGILHTAHDPDLNAVDLDGLITKADPRCPVCPAGMCRGHLVGCHWQEPMIRDGFHDPAGRLERHAMVRDMTLEEVCRLEATTDGHTYRIRPLAHLVALCGHHGVTAVVEPKPDHRWEEEWPWRQLLNAAHVGRTDLRAYALRNLPVPGAGARRLAPAHRLGIPAWLIG
jgi:hypothetical protein